MDAQTLSYYEQNAADIARRYEAAGEGVASLFPFVFRAGERVLEIGAGSGRDTARLLDLGVEVQAVEPSAAMRREAAAAHPELAGRLHEGHLPGGIPAELKDPWDGVLLSAVIMHIPDAELFDAAFELRGLLKPGGVLLLSLPVSRPDVTTGEERDDKGRLMVVRPVERVRLLFERLGFQLEHEWSSSDSAGRDILWTSLVLRYSGVTSRAIDRVESIINADRKVATYKLALIRALTDIATTSWGRVSWERAGVVSVPLEDVSERWLRYYWPLVEEDGNRAAVTLPQINAEAEGGKPIAFRGALTELIQACRALGGLEGFARRQAEGTLPADVRELGRAAARIIGATIVKGPVQFAGNARGEPEFRFHAGHIVVRADVWRELSLMGHWIRDAVVLRWAEMTARLSKGKVATGEVIDRLLDAVDPLRQDPAVVSLYQSRREGLECVWTGSPLRRDFDVDHAIPFTYWQASPMWNLFPAAKAVNNHKREKLPTVEIIRKREAAIVQCWRMLSGEYPLRFQREAEGLTGAGLGKDWEKPLLAGFVEAVEYTAATRGAERWEPG